METWTLCEECDAVVYLKDTTQTERGFRCSDTLICQRRKELRNQNRDNTEPETVEAEFKEANERKGEQP